MTTTLGGSPRSNGRWPIGARRAVILVVVSSSIVTVSLLIWLVPPLFAFGGFAFMTIGWVALGPPLGLLASMAVLGSYEVLLRVTHPIVAVVAASIIGWAIALLAWLLIGFGSPEGTGLAIPGAVTLVGCTSSVIVAWPRRALDLEARSVGR